MLSEAGDTPGGGVVLVAGFVHDRWRRAAGGKTLPLPCVSTALAAETLPLPCVLTAFLAQTLPFLAGHAAAGPTAEAIAVLLCKVGEEAGPEASGGGPRLTAVHTYAAGGAAEFPAVTPHRSPATRAERGK